MVSLRRERASSSVSDKSPTAIKIKMIIKIKMGAAVHQSAAPISFHESGSDKF